MLLRRKVAAQLALIESKLQAEAATEERHRIAREFHDTLEQSLAAVSLRLDVAAYTATDDQSRQVLKQQRRLLSGLQTETRDFLWDLRDPSISKARSKNRSACSCATSRTSQQSRSI